MAGSKGGKHSRRRGNTKYNKSETINKKTEVSQTSNIHPDGPRDFNDMNIDAVLDFEFPTLTRVSSYTLEELVQFLYVKVDLLYTKAQDKLLKSGYSKAEVESAILHAGFVHGKMDIFSNVCQNAIAYIGKKSEPRTEAFQSLTELCGYMLETMVGYVMETQRKQRWDAIWHLLIKNWGFVPSTITLSNQRSRDTSSIWFRESNVSSRGLSQNEDIGSLDPSSADKVLFGMHSSSKKAGLLGRISFTPAALAHFRLTALLLADAVQMEIEDRVIRIHAFPRVTVNPISIPDIVCYDFLSSLTDCSFGACLIGCLESDSIDRKTALIVDLIRDIRQLHKNVKERKEWAQKKVIDAARKLSRDLLELKLLRAEEFNKEPNKLDFMKEEMLYSEKSCTLILMETEQRVQEKHYTTMVLINTMKSLAGENAQIRADIEATKLNSSDSNKQLLDVLKRERSCSRKLADVEKQTRIFQSQFEEEKQKLVQLEIELLHAEKEIFEAEMKWRHEIREKEHTYARLAVERKRVKTQKANSGAQLLKLKQKVDIDSQLARDDLRRLEASLASLRISDQMPDAFLENDSFWRDSAGSSALMGSSSKETIRHWICMMCLQNEVSILLLPCTHQVLCSPCYLENFKTVGGCCPYCHVKIEESIKVYGPGS